VAYSFRDYLPGSSNSQLLDTTIPYFRKPPTPPSARLPLWISPPESPNTFGNPPQNQPRQQLPDYLHIWDPPIPAAPSSRDIPGALPSWISPLLSPPENPFPPPEHPPHDVDPPMGNPRNFPDRKFVVTENISQHATDEPGGGLPGMLLRALMQQGQVQLGTDSVSDLDGAPEYRPELNPETSSTPQGGLLGRLLALHDERAGNTVDAYGNVGPGETRAGRTYATPPQEIPAAPRMPVRRLARRPID
jgi:hypothetical protein